MVSTAPDAASTCFGLSVRGPNTYFVWNCLSQIICQQRKMLFWKQAFHSGTAFPVLAVINECNIVLAMSKNTLLA